MKAIMGMAAAVVLLAGGSGKDGGGNNSSDGGGGGSAAASAGQEEAPVNLTQDPSNGAVPMTPPSPTPLASMPANFQGRWGMTAADCDPANAAAAKGLMTITADRITFYESRGVPTRLRHVAPGTLAFDLPMSGEGQTWSEPTRLTMPDDGRTLVRQATGSPDRAGSFTYSRCPA